MSPSKMLSVLVIDDLKSARKVLARHLESSCECHVVEAENGEEALKLMGEIEFDLILSDHHMPKMDGLTLLSIIRGQTATAQMPFLLVTSSAQRDIVDKALKLHVSDIMIKPFTPETLRDKITEVLSKSVIDPPQAT